MTQRASPAAATDRLGARGRTLGISQPGDRGLGECEENRPRPCKQNTFGARRRQKWGLEKTHAGSPGEMVVVIFTSLRDAEHCNFAN